MRVYVNISDALMSQLAEIEQELSISRTALINIAIKDYLDAAREKKAKLKNLES